MSTMVVTVTAAGVSVAPATDPGSPVSSRPTLPITLDGVDQWLAAVGYQRLGTDWDTALYVGGLCLSAVVVKIGDRLRHTCNGGAGPHWGRRTPGCPRCDDLEAGAPPTAWAGSRGVASTASHRCDSRCGPVCTAGDW